MATTSLGSDSSPDASMLDSHDVHPQHKQSSDNVEVLKAIENMREQASAHYRELYEAEGIDMVGDTTVADGVASDEGNDGAVSFESILHDFHGQKGIFEKSFPFRKWEATDFSKLLDPVEEDDENKLALQYAIERFQDHAFRERLSTALVHTILKQRIKVLPEWRYFENKDSLIPVLLTKEWLTFALMYSTHLRQSTRESLTIITGSSGIGVLLKPPNQNYTNTL